jgi:hypothetical protein
MPKIKSTKKSKKVKRKRLKQKQQLLHKNEKVLFQNLKKS